MHAYCWQSIWLSDLQPATLCWYSLRCLKFARTCKLHAVCAPLIYRLRAGDNLPRRPHCACVVNRWNKQPRQSTNSKPGNRFRPVPSNSSDHSKCHSPFASCTVHVEAPLHATGQYSSPIYSSANSAWRQFRKMISGRLCDGTHWRSCWIASSLAVVT